VFAVGEEVVAVASAKLAMPEKPQPRRDESRPPPAARIVCPTEVARRAGGDLPQGWTGAEGRSTREV